jgi:hypothetical protein
LQSWYNQCDEGSQRKLEAGEAVICPTEYGDRIVRKDFAEKSRKMELNTSKPIDVKCPIRLDCKFVLGSKKPKGHLGGLKLVLWSM